MNLPDLSKIPKFVIWIVITFSVISIVLLAKSYVEYAIFKPYQKYFEVDCRVTDNTSVFIITAKKTIENITVSDVDGNILCKFDKITANSMNVCEYKNPKIIGRTVYIRIKYTTQDGTFTAVKDCKVVVEKSLIQSLLSKLS